MSDKLDIEAIRAGAVDNYCDCSSCNRDDVDPLCDEVEALRARVRELVAKGETVCPWTEESDPYSDPCYHTSCKASFVLIDGGPKNNDYEFCPCCGKKIVEIVKTEEGQKP